MSISDFASRNGCIGSHHVDGDDSVDRYAFSSGPTDAETRVPTSAGQIEAS